MKLFIVILVSMAFFGVSTSNENQCLEDSRYFQSLSPSGIQEEEFYPNMPVLKVFPFEQSSTPVEDDLLAFFGTTDRTEGFFSHLNGIHNHNHRSFCPWRYDVDVDVNRIPMNIPKVVCDCEHCLNSAGDEMMHTSCKRVTYTRPVLRLYENEDCKKIYYIVNEEIPVACTCQRNPVINLAL